MNEGIIYVLTNPCFTLGKDFQPIIKIGMTKRDDVRDRMSDLFTTGLPEPFECLFAYKVKNVDHVEKELHQIFDMFRHKKNREFFSVWPDMVIRVLCLIDGEDVTPINEIDDDF